jgi:glycosyltransferase involved in cell wall biosynthesis
MTPSQKSHTVIWLIDALGMGGAERLMEPYLQHLDKTRFTPRVGVFQVKDGNPLAERLRNMGIAVDLVPVAHLRDPLALPRVIGYLRRQKADLIHTQLEFANTLGTLAGRWLRRPTLTTLHTYDGPDLGAKTYRRIRLMWRVLRRYDRRIIAVSEGLRQHHLQHAGFAPEQIVTLYNGINLDRFTPADVEARQTVRHALQIPATAPLLITVAVLRPPKGIQHMITALPRVLAAQPDAYYLVVGDGDYGPALKAQAAASGLAERVIFAGVRHDIPALLATADLFVLPTLGDALPTVLIEAMAAQVPIVASDVGGVPELVENGRNGLLTPPANPDQLAAACVQLLHNPALAAEMGRNGRQIAAAKFDIHTQVARLGQLYEELLA